MSGDLRLHLFDSGTLGFGGVNVPVPFFLLRHPRGNVVIDGGNPLAVARDAHAHWGSLADEFEIHMTEEQHCSAQLQRLGVAPDSIRYIVQTHLHIDHTGALGHFPSATVIVHADELQAARAVESPIASAYARQDYDRPDLRWRQTQGELDLLGDGTVRLIETPGHSAGHMSVLLQLEDTGPVLLTADAVDNRRQWEGRDDPRALVSSEDASRSLERLRRLAGETNALIIFGHDPKNWSQHKHVPEFYS